MLLGNVKMLTI